MTVIHSLSLRSEAIQRLFRTFLDCHAASRHSMTRLWLPPHDNRSRTVQAPSLSLQAKGRAVEGLLAAKRHALTRKAPPPNLPLRCCAPQGEEQAQ
jgi:hypothetical protein